MKKLIYFLVLLNLFFPFCSKAQYVDLSGNNPYIKQYVEENPDNWDRSIIYVFYNNTSCVQCAQSMGMIYDIYEEYYANSLSLFEINYQTIGEFQFQIDYNLDQPLSVVLVRIEDGIARGYYKIDNPQIWVNNPQYFSEYMKSSINNFLLN